MCHLVRERQAGATQSGDVPLPPNLDRLRPRWIGVAALALVGGLAVAAMVGPPTATTRASVKDAAAPAPIAAKAVATSTPAGVGRGSAPVDDGVPGASDTARAGIGHCDHDL